MVRGAHILGPDRNIPVSAVRVPIYRTSPRFLLKSYAAAISAWQSPDGILCKNRAVLLGWEYYLDYVGVRDASLPISH